MRRKKKNARIYLLLLFLFLAMGVVYAALTTSFSVSGTVGVSSAKYTINYTGSNATFSSASNTIIYGSTTTNKITPSTGYYLKSLSCTNGYTTNATTGTGATSAQTVTINNNSKTTNSTCTFTGSNSYTIAMSGSNVTFGATSLAITYGGSKTVTLTPSTGYYLNSISCTNGYTVTATTGTSATGAQTITIKNNSKATNSTCTATMSKRTFTATITGGNTAYSKTSVSIPYDGTGTVDVTPNTGGYYLGTATCTNGYTITGGNYGKGNTGTQTLTINNNGNLKDTTCTITSIHAYNVTFEGTNVTFGANTAALAYGGTTTVKLTPSAGYYLSSLTCTNGYTVTANMGPNTGGSSEQTITVKNPSVAKDSVCTAKMANTYPVYMFGSNVTYSSTNLVITYGSSKTVTLTPSTGYYLKSFTCQSGITHNATTGTSATGAQTITIKNNNFASSASCTATMEQTYTGPTEWEFTYTGNIQSFIVPVSGTYKLEVYGAQGGKCSNVYDNCTNSKGGYSYGSKTLTKDSTLYVVVGGAGTDVETNQAGNTTISGGYNGGGSGGSGPYYKGASGGGATHIATSTGLLSSLSSNTSAILIVAGGAGGGDHSTDNFAKYYDGGTGGGTSGGAGTGSYPGGSGGTQTSGAAFGRGGNCTAGTATEDGCGGGGGGFYGGLTSINRGGGGGSGYIGGVTGGSMSNGVRAGNGYAKITLVSKN